MKIFDKYIGVWHCTVTVDNSPYSNNIDVVSVSYKVDDKEIIERTMGLRTFIKAMTNGYKDKIEERFKERGYREALYD